MNTTTNDTAENKYILLDWSVFKYLKNPRETYHDLDVDCLTIIKCMKKYEFPFCEARILDLSRSNPKEKIEEDLRFLEQVSHNVALGWRNENIYFQRNCSAFDLFRNITKYEPNKINITPDKVPIVTSRVDMDRINSAYPLKSMLETTDGIIGPDILSNLLNKLYDRFFNENVDYKNIRDYIKNIIESSNNNDTQENMYIKEHKEFLELIIDSFVIEDLDKLVLKWKNITLKWLQMNHTTEIPFGEQITTAYSLLDLHPKFNEKLKNKKNALSNIVRDSKIIYYASSIL